MNENELNKPVAYTPNIDDYLAWLKDGISKFK
jgi:thiol:disulfide interchange protein DsbD